MLSYSGSGGGGLVTVASLSPNLTSVKSPDLGKPTMRGIRKCPKCGTFNGTRGLSCKNKTCDMVFKAGRNILMKIQKKKVIILTEKIIKLTKSLDKI